LPSIREPRKDVVLASTELVLAVAAEQVVDALRDSGVRSILLKGPVHARWLYDDGPRRPYTDVDLLVARSAVGAAGQVLASLGFTYLYDDGHGHAWRRQDDDVTIDLHWTLSGVAAGVDPFETLVGETEPFVPIREEVDVLKPHARALHVALHAAHHGGPEARFVEDLERALARATSEEWRRAAGLAEQLGATAAFTAGLRLTPSGSELAEELGLPHEENAEVSLRSDGLAPAVGGLIRLSREPRLRGKAALLAREAFPRPAYMRAQSPLARRGNAGLAAAYVTRLGELAWHVPGAWLALRRARRSGGP
jgi:hypothetical protein